MKRFLLNHGKLTLSVIAGIAGFFLAPAHWSTVADVLTGWNAGVLFFFVILVVRMRGLSSDQLRAHYKEDDPSAPLILLFVVVAALLSLVAIVALLATLKQTHGAERTEHVALATLTIVNSWLLVPTMFTLHYADLYYSVAAEKAPLDFPKTPHPVIWDFAYFSFTISAACQTADVATTHVGIRRLVTVHTLISFLFNASILGFAINVSAGLLGT
ncbi:MAG TPA: DUF1345 domain-containing protein [Steroidobacteraceae bacterium]|jgi:uncharacterized membrane protein